jgi:hypothetical protein
MVVLCEVPSEFQARSLVIVLEDAGIRAFTFGAGELPHVANLTTGKVRGVTVHVARRDEPAARALLNELPTRTGEIDWDAIEVGEEEESERPDETKRASSFSSPSAVRILLVVAGLGLTLAVVGLLLELTRRQP